MKQLFWNQRKKSLKNQFELTDLWKTIICVRVQRKFPLMINPFICTIEGWNCKFLGKSPISSFNYCIIREWPKSLPPFLSPRNLDNFAPSAFYSTPLPKIRNKRVGLKFSYISREFIITDCGFYEFRGFWQILRNQQKFPFCEIFVPYWVNKSCKDATSIGCWFMLVKSVFSRWRFWGLQFA